MDTNSLINAIAFTTFALLWVGFAATLLFKQQVLGNIWEYLRSLPILVQLLLWVLALPVMLGLWVWQTAWPLWLRLVLVTGLAWVTLYTFFPQSIFA